MTTSEFITEIVALDRARFPLLYLVTSEETRALVTLKQVAHLREKAFYSWTFTDGWVDHDGRPALRDHAQQSPLMAVNQVHEAVSGREAEALYVLQDLDPFLDDPAVVRRLRDCAALLPPAGHTAILLSPRLVLPPHLASTFHVLDFPLPDREILEQMVDGSIGMIRKDIVAGGDPDPTPEPLLRGEIVRALSGLTLDEAENIVAKSLVARRRLDPELIVREKQQAIRKTEVLEVVTPIEGLDQVGGHDRLKQWLQEAQLSFSDDARAFGVEPVKGALFVGVPGTAKSLIVKALARDWHLPLVRVDVGRLMGSLVGQSEQRAREMTQILEASAPVVAWLDEVEKGLGGAQSSARSDAGTTARVFGHLLTFFQETRAPIAFFATANDTSLLPPELLRRFDAIWFFDVPTEAEAKPIWAIHLRKRQRDPRTYDLDRLACGSIRYTGAEIEKAVKEALRRAFLDGRRDVTEQDLLDILQSAEPLAQSHADQIEAAKKHLGGLARPTSAGESGTKTLRRPSPRAVDLR